MTQTQQEFTPIPTGSKQAPPKPARFAKYYDDLLLRLYGGENGRQGILPTVGMASCGHGEGVSTLAANLAIRAAQALPDPVLLLEIAAEPSSLKRNLGVGGSVDFAEILSGRVQTVDCIQTTPVNNLSVLAVGARDRGWGYLHPPSIAGFLKEIREEFALMVVDLPPANEPGPCLAFAGQLDGVLLVVEAERVSCRAAQRSKQRLLHVGANLLGVIFNKRREHLPGWFFRQR